MDSVSPHKWCLALSALLIMIVAGIFVLVLLALGLADPPLAGTLRWQSASVEGWLPVRCTGESEMFIAPIRIPRPPFTVVASASNHGEAHSAWGLWLETVEGIQMFQVSNEGYLSVSSDDSTHWAQFFHIQSPTNKLYLHVQTDDIATFRVNDEIAWQARLTEVEGLSWGVARYGKADLAWEYIRVYAP